MRRSVEATIGASLRPGMVLLLLTAVLPASGAERATIVSTLPTLTALAKEIGGERFEYVTLAKADQDPHFVSPVPSLMRRTRDAAVFFEIGMQLEPWADQVADGSGNPRIFRGASGRVPVSLGVPAEEVPSVITRAEGDLHPQGNPHIWLDPVRAKMIAARMAEALIAAAPEEEKAIGARLDSFRQRIAVALYGAELIDLVGVRKLDRLTLDGTLWSFLNEREIGGKSLVDRTGGWLAEGHRLRGVPVVEYHRVWVYFCKTFGMELLGTVEEKPGIPPGPRHQREITQRIRSRDVKLILVDNFYAPTLPRKIAAETGVRVVILPNQVGGEPGVDDYFQLIDYLLQRMLEEL